MFCSISYVFLCIYYYICIYYVNIYYDYVVCWQCATRVHWSSSQLLKTQHGVQYQLVIVKLSVSQMLFHLAPLYRWIAAPELTGCAKVGEPSQGIWGQCLPEGVHIRRELNGIGWMIGLGVGHYSSESSCIPYKKVRL
jgi:hypothetical protein